MKGFLTNEGLVMAEEVSETIILCRFLFLSGEALLSAEGDSGPPSEWSMQKHWWFLHMCHCQSSVTITFSAPGTVGHPELPSTPNTDSAEASLWEWWLRMCAYSGVLVRHRQGNKQSECHSGTPQSFYSSCCCGSFWRLADLGWA